jgi:hypothetical protein
MVCTAPCNTEYCIAHVADFVCHLRMSYMVSKALYNAYAEGFVDLLREVRISGEHLIYKCPCPIRDPICF